MQYKKIIQLELNELSKTLLTQALTKHSLPHLQKMVDTFNCYTTISETDYKNIEPWIVWINAHTGKDYAEHGVFHLADSSMLTHPQLWETLSKAGYESLIFGCMNTKRGDTHGGIYFPDPWTKMGEAYPKDLQPLFELISNKVQTHATKALSFGDLWRGLVCARHYRLPWYFFAKVAKQLLEQTIFPKRRWRLAGLFDEMLAHIFCQILGKTDFAFNALFLNAIAHYQHHYWRNHEVSHFDKKIMSPDAYPHDDPILFGLKIYDSVLGNLLKVLETQPDTLLIVATGFSQEPFTQCEAQGGMNYYRLNEHHKLVALLGLYAVKVFPLMSRDWQIVADNAASCAAIHELLDGLTVAGEKLFRCQQNSSTSLFIETQLTHAIAADAYVENQQGVKLFKFHDFFSCTAIKSGHHISEGSLWTSGVVDSLNNTQTLPITQLYSLTLANFNLAVASEPVANIKKLQGEDHGLVAG